MAYIAQDDEDKKDENGQTIQSSSGSSGTITGDDAPASDQTASTQPAGGVNTPQQQAGSGMAVASGSAGGGNTPSVVNTPQPQVEQPQNLNVAQPTSIPKALQRSNADNMVDAPIAIKPPAITPQSRKQSGSFTNIQKYLQGNAGAGLAEKVAGNIEGQFGQARQNLKTGAQGLAQEALNKGVDLSPDFINAGIANAGAQQGAQKQLADQFAEYKKAVDTGYQGPKSLEELQNLNDIRSQYSGAVGQAELTGSEPGRFALINQMFGTPSYTQGSKRLDQLLLQNDPQARARFEALKQLSGEAQGDIGRAGEQFGALAGNQANRYTSAANAIQRGLRNQDYNLSDVPQEVVFDGLQGVAGNTAPMLEAYNRQVGEEAIGQGNALDVGKIQQNLAGKPITQEIDYSAPASNANPKAFNPIYALQIAGYSPQQANALMLTPLAQKMNQVQGLIANRTFQVEAPKNVPVDPITGLPSIETYSQLPGGIGSAVIKDDKGNPVATVADLLYKRAEDLAAKLNKDTGDQMRSVNMALFSGTIDPKKDPKTFAIIFGRQPSAGEGVVTIPQEYRQALINAVAYNQTDFSDALTPEMKNQYIGLAGLVGLKPEEQKITAGTEARAETPEQNVSFDQGQAKNIIAGVNQQKSDRLKQYASKVDAVLKSPVQNHGKHQPVSHEFDVNYDRYKYLLNQQEPPRLPFGGYQSGPGYLSLAAEVAGKVNDVIVDIQNESRRAGYSTSWRSQTSYPGHEYNIQNELKNLWRGQRVSENEINNRLRNGQIQNWVRSKAIARTLDEAKVNFGVIGRMRSTPNLYQGQNENLFQNVTRMFR